MTDIRSYATAIPHTRASVNRAVSAGLFLIRQIQSGSVPDINRVLRAYKLHPNQAFLYRKDDGMGQALKSIFGAGGADASDDYII